MCLVPQRRRDDRPAAGAGRGRVNGDRTTRARRRGHPVRRPRVAAVVAPRPEAAAAPAGRRPARERWTTPRGVANPTVAARSMSSTRISLLRTPLSTTERSRTNVAEECRASPRPARWAAAGRRRPGPSCAGGPGASRQRRRRCAPAARAPRTRSGGHSRVHLVDGAQPGGLEEPATVREGAVDRGSGHEQGIRESRIRRPRHDTSLLSARWAVGTGGTGTGSH